MAAADHAHELRDTKRTAEERASELKLQAKREIDVLKSELAAANTSSEAAVKVLLSTAVSIQVSILCCLSLPFWCKCDDVR